LLKNLQNLFSISERVEERRHRANIESMRAKPQLMAGDSVQLRQNDANKVGAGRSFNVEQLFNGLAVAQAIRDRRHIIHTVHVWIEHRVSAVLGDFLHASMQIGDDAFRAQYLLAVEFQNHAQHAVSGWMLRSHINNEFVGIEESLFAFAQFKMRQILSGVGGHWPLSIPRLICTHSLSCWMIP